MNIEDIYLIFQFIGIPPYGMLAFLDITLGMIGLTVQIIGLIGIIISGNKMVKIES